VVDIALIAREHGFSLRITDNGVGLAQAAPSAAGMGLKIMKYRADMIGARFDITANQPHGAVIAVAG
jgi:signal transduction histidine kinase